jgi:sulfate adenylyltransferase
MIRPHGGVLIERIASQEKRDQITRDQERYTRISMDKEKLQDIANIAHGVYSPLTGFLCEEDFKSVLSEGRLADGTPWPIPIVLDASESEAGQVEIGQEVLLTDGKRPIASLEVREKYSYSKDDYASKVFGTNDRSHPGVEKTYTRAEVLLGGDLELLMEPDLPYIEYTLRPKETRVLFREKGWRDVVGFQTRNVPHLGHEYIQKTALAFTDGLFINPVVGRKKSGDFLDDVILATYDELLKHYYLKQRAVLVVLHMEMRYAGPREAIFHSIIRKNYGCTHFIVGRDHAGVGNFYPPFAAHEIFERYPDLGIVPLFFESFFHCSRCGGVTNQKTCPHGADDRVNFSGTNIRELLKRGDVPSEELMRPEIAKVILQHPNPFVE